MLDRPQARELPATTPGPESLLQSVAPCDARALRRLTTAFDQARPAAVLIGHGHARSSQVVDTFLANLDDKTCVARIQAPGANRSAYMREIIRAIGFEPKDFGLADLDKILQMFLCHQRTHACRTVICIEDAQDCDDWILNNICELADIEVEQLYGLFVVVSGDRRLNDLLYRHPLQDIGAHAGSPIPVSPLALTETREFVLQQIGPEHSDDVTEIIKLDAITRLHEIGAGDPDTVSGLCAESLQTAASESAFPITSRAVNRAACTLGLISNPSPVLRDHVDNSPIEIDRLIVRVGGNMLGERALDSDSIAIGRDLRNDLSIPCLTVSRHHLLVVAFAKGVKLVDLGSTNGTYVNGARISSHVLENGDKIRLGECELEYVAAG